MKLVFVLFLVVPVYALGPAGLGVRLSEVEAALGPVASAVMVYRKLGDIGLVGLDVPRTRESLSGVIELSSKWLEEMDVDDSEFRKTWASLAQLLATAQAAWELFRSLPDVPFSKLALPEFEEALSSIEAIQRELISLTEAIEAEVGDGAWFFYVAYIAHPIRSFAAFGPVVPEEKRQFLMENVPPLLSEEGKGAFWRLMELIPDRFRLWDDEEKVAAQDAAATLLSEVLSLEGGRGEG